MILSKGGILKAIESGDISISPFDESKLNPNSYNLSLNEKLIIYTDPILDMKRDNQTKEIIIPEEGYTLLPGNIYLARTNEYTITNKYIPMLEGRSSIGRLGMSIHVTAGFGDIGFEGYWTLEITVEQPLRVYPNVEVCQIYYVTTDEYYDEKDAYNGKYAKNNDVQSSMLFKEFMR